MSRRLFWAFLASVSLLVLIISPVSAAPALNLGNHASYNLSGLLQASQSCTADPAQYASQACGFGGPPPGNQIFNVFWYDNGSCSPNNFSCNFSPRFLSIPTGSGVQWSHSGSLTHTATSNTTLNPGLPSFDSGAVPPGSTFTNFFSVAGTYHYYCAIHPWMRGELDVSGPPPQPQPQPQPMPMTFKVNLDGTVAWTVRGLSTDTANLKVDHKVGVSISPQPGVTFTPLTEQGSFEQSIALATRVESPGTATSIILALLRSVPALYLGGPRYPVGSLSSGSVTTITSGGPTRLPPNQTLVITSATRPVTPFDPTVFSQMPALFSDPGQPVYTMWWVNGPLSLGSPVKILTGSSSVTGDENLNLGTSLGTRAGWLVTSQFSQSVNASAPSPTTSSSNISFALNLLWSFDKRGDVLLRSSADVAVMATNMNMQQTYTNPCAPNGYCPTYVSVVVTRTITATLNLALRLASTELNLNNRARLGTQSSFLETMANIPWLPFGAVGAVAAGIVGAGVWYVRRGRGKTLELGGSPPFPA